MKKYWFILTVFIAVFACREPFDFGFPDIENDKVVIDGFLTNRGTEHEVRVSYTASINDDNIVVTNFIEDASVIIEDDQGNFTALRHKRGGIYVTSRNYQAQEGRTYSVVVTLPNGTVYRSAPSTMPAPSPATAQIEIEGNTRETLLDNNRIDDVEGASVIATIDKDAGRHFYQWDITHYYIYQADLAPEELAQCYIKDFDATRVELLQDNPLDGGESSNYSYEIDFIPISARMRFEFGVEARLLTMNEEDYNFWLKVKRLAENTGGLFDAAPFSLEGNITNQATGELALGHFAVYRESFDREFFVLSDLGFGNRTFNPCTLPPMAELPHPCTDCREFVAQENYGVVRPPFWRN